MRENQKLYVVTRRDLAPGTQAVQGMHALVEFSAYHTEEYFKWFRESNHLCFLSVDSELELDKLCSKLYNAKVKYCGFREPDLNMTLTALAIEASDEASDTVKDLKLALRW